MRKKKYTAEERKASNRYSMIKNSGKNLLKLNEVLNGFASQWVKAIEPVVREQERIQKSIHTIAKPLLETQRSLEQTIAPIAKHLIAFQQQVEPFLHKIEHLLNNFPTAFKEALRILAQNGWYPQPDFPPQDLIKFAEFFKSNKKLQANEQLCDYFNTRLVDIESSLCEKLPMRKKILHSAFEAHRRDEFALSIPVFLAQADGVCCDITNIPLYSRPRGIPMLANLIHNDEPTLINLLLTPLVEPMPISANQNERAGITDVFNRHSILHGESIDYDSLLNSCRAISLLFYVSWILRKL